MMSFRSFFPSLVVGAFAAAGLAAAQDQSIVQIAQGNEQFTTLLAAVAAADPAVLTELQGEGPLTLFAPTDDAFDHLPNGAVDFLLGDTVALTEVLFYHVLTSEVFSSSIDNGDTALTAAGETVSFHVWKYFDWRRWRWLKNIIVNGNSLVTTADVDATNGVIHIINRVLIPPTVTIPLDIVDTAKDAGSFTLLLAALQITGLDQVLAAPSGPYTVVAPNDEAFLKLPPGALRYLLKDENQGDLADILAYHVLQGQISAADIRDGTASGDTLLVDQTLSFDVANGTVVINKDEATVVATDIAASNGIIHVIDSVLLPATIELPKDVVGTAEDAGTFNTLLAALDAAGLTETLQGEGRFTVFGPTDKAFDNLPEGRLNELLADPTGELKDLLLYHVVLGELSSADIIEEDGDSIRTLSGKKVDISVVNGEVVLNDEATVGPADVIALNGVVHVIDEVLTMPEAVECPFPWTWLCNFLGY